MDFKQVEAYIKVIELSSFSKAADSLFLSQSSVSLYIISLEKELKTVLINRSAKEITPTFAGKIFYENAKELITLKQNTIAKIKNISDNFEGEIKILASTVPSQYILPKIIANFTKDYPLVSFCVKQSDSKDVVSGIEHQHAEIGIVGNIIENNKCSFNEFGKEKIIFIAPIGFEQTYSLEEVLYKNNFISREKGSGTRKHYEDYFSKNGIDISKINFGTTFDNTQSIISAVMNGLGVSMISQFAAEPFIKKKMITQINVQSPVLERSFYYVLRNNLYRSHLTDLFIDFLKSNITI